MHSTPPDPKPDLTPGKSAILTDPAEGQGAHLAQLEDKSAANAAAEPQNIDQSPTSPHVASDGAAGGELLQASQRQLSVNSITNIQNERDGLHTEDAGIVAKEQVMEQQIATDHGA